MKVQRTLIIGVVVLLVILTVCGSMMGPAKQVARGPRHFFDENQWRGPRDPRGGDDWTQRPDLVR